jgi:hypothetical protein
MPVFDVSVISILRSFDISKFKSEVFGDEVLVIGLVFNNFSISESNIGNCLSFGSVVTIIDPCPISEVITVGNGMPSVNIVSSEVVSEVISCEVEVSIIIQPDSESSVS